MSFASVVCIVTAPHSLKELCKSGNGANTPAKLALISNCIAIFTAIQAFETTLKNAKIVLDYTARLDT